MDARLGLRNEALVSSLRNFVLEYFKELATRCHNLLKVVLHLDPSEYLEQMVCIHTVEESILRYGDDLLLTT